MPSPITIDVTPPGWGNELIASYVIQGEKTAIIDTGPAGSYERLREAMKSFNIKPDYIILTHIHLDHGGATGHIVRDNPNAKVLVHPKGAKHMANPTKLWNAAKVVLGPVAEVYGEPLPVPEENLIPVEDGYKLDLGNGLLLEIYHTPGHASHHMSILLRPLDIIFTGDSAGVSIILDGVRVELPTTPPPFHLERYLESLDKMIALHPKKPAPAHFGIKDEDAVEYLSREKARSVNWYNMVKELVMQGVTDVDEVARILADKDKDAGISYRHPNPIVREVFYRGTVWGLIEAVKKDLGI